MVSFRAKGIVCLVHASCAYTKQGKEMRKPEKKIRKVGGELIAALFAVVSLFSVAYAENLVPRNRNWKIVYGEYAGCERRAVEFLSTEIGALIQRDAGVYTLHVVPCERVGAESETNRNAVVIGTRGSNALLREMLSESDVPEGGYLVRVTERNGRQLVLIAGDTPAAAIWGAVDFVDDGLAKMRTRGGDYALYLSGIFEKPRLPAYESRRSPKTKRRSIFSWAHVMNDYRTYFRNLARMKFNEAILWNEFPPLNAREVAEYARSWGIEILWGWSWGWSTNCHNVDFDHLKELEDDIVRQWREVWRPCGGGGIYFQSFTEINEADLKGHSVAETVVKLVNGAAGRILADEPDLRIVFGLHSASVKSRLAEIAKTNLRLEILWENCGGFPYNLTGGTQDETEGFVRKLLDMGRPATGFAYKSQVLQDWHRFAHQAGPYVLGQNSRAVIAEDRRVVEPLWQRFEREWLMRGEQAHAMTRLIQSRAENKGSLNVVGNLNEPIHVSTALCAELFWNADEPYEKILERVLSRAWLNRE